MRLGRLALALAVLLPASAFMMFGAPAPAGAHAVVVTSSPAAGQVIPRAPGEAWVQFSEPVKAEPGALRVLDSEGERVDLGSSESSGRDVLRVGLEPDLPDGTYVVDYRVVSADGHPVAGAIVFGVGDGTTIDAAVADAAEPEERMLEVGAGVARFATYVGALLAAGLALFMAFFVRGVVGVSRRPEPSQEPAEPERRRAVQVVRAAALVGAIGAVAVVGFQAALVTGRGFSAAFDPDALRRTLDGGLGWATAVLLVGLAAVHVSVHLRAGAAGQVLAFYGWLTVGASFALWGHTGSAEPRWVALVADVVHVVAASVWLGGLVGLTLVLVSVGKGGTMRAASIVVRFSDAAAVSAAALVLAGAALSFTQVSGLGQLFSTRYGQLLLVKIALVAVVLGLAAYNRWRLRPALDEHPEPWGRLTRTVMIEGLLLVAALAVTSALVVVTPARTTAEVSGVVTLSAPLQLGGELDITVVPGEVGANVVHIQYFDDVGRPYQEVRSVTVELTKPDGGLGPITTGATRAGPGHFIANDLQIPSAGEWQLTTVARIGDFDQDRTTFPLSVN